MKTKTFYIFLFIIFSIVTVKSQVTIGSNENADTSALLDLKNKADNTSDKGFLLPKVGITNAAQFGLAGNSRTEGILVYNTVANASNSGKGLYYWSGNNWNQLQGSDSQFNWLLNGNTNGALRTLGTKDAFDFSIITNNTERMRVTSSGNVGVGTATPKSRFSVSGGAISQDDFTAGDKFFMLGYPNSPKISLNTDMNFASYAGSLVQSNGTDPSSSNTGVFTWSVADASNSWREVARLANNARLGIGTTNPQATLHVAGTALMEQDMKVLTLPQASPIDQALVADTNGNVKLTTTSIPQRFNYTLAGIAPGATGTITRPIYTNYTAKYYTLTVTTTNNCGDVAVVNFIGNYSTAAGVLSFIGGQAQGVNYNVEIYAINTRKMTVNLPTPCAGATSSQFNFSIVPTNTTISITNNGTTTLDYNLSLIEY